jgi:hypothetical protein
VTGYRTNSTITGTGPVLGAGSTRRSLALQLKLPLIVLLASSNAAAAVSLLLPVVG